MPGVPPGLRQAPTDISHFGANVVAGLAHVVLIMIARHTLETTIRELWKTTITTKTTTRFITHKFWRVYVIPGALEQGYGLRESMQRPGVLLFWGLSVLKKRKLHGWGGLTLYPVVLLAVCFLEMAVFEVGASTIKSLMSGMYITSKLSDVDNTRGLRMPGNQHWNIIMALSLANIFT